MAVGNCSMTPDWLAAGLQKLEHSPSHRMRILNLSDSGTATASSSEVAETLTTVSLELAPFRPRHHQLLEARPIKPLEARRRSCGYQSNEPCVCPLYFVKAAAVLLGLFGLCCAFDSIEQAVGLFNDESHLLFADPNTESFPCEGLRVFTKDNIVVPELELEDEIIIKALGDALEDFRINYSEKKDGEWRRVIAAKERLVANARWGTSLKERQKIFLDCAVDLIFQHYERRILDTGDKESKSRLGEVKRRRYPDNVPKSLEQAVFEGNNDTWNKYRQAVSHGGNVPQLMPVLGQKMFRKHVVSRIPNITLEKRGKNVVRISVSSLDDEEQLGIVAKNLWWLPHLETIEIRKSRFGPSTAKELAKSLECLKHLTTLDLSNNKVGSADVEEIAGKLARMPGLTTLDLKWNWIGERGAKHIAEHLRSVPSLTTLDLRGNDIGDGGAKHIADHLRDSPSLTTLSFGRNLIGEEGVKHIAEHLGDAKNLNILNLSFNEIGDGGAKYIAKHLGDAKSLSILDLSFNEIGDGGAWHIIEHLKYVPSLTILNLINDRITYEGARHIAEHLKDAPSLTTLDLRANEIGRKDADAIAKMLVHVPNLFI